MDEEEAGRRLALTALFGSLGWKIYRQEVSELLKGELGKIKELTKKALTPDNLTELNAAVERRNAVLNLLYIEDELKGELE